jgi:hypothetical protein
MKDIHDIFPKNIPTNLEETHSKIVGARDLVIVKGFNHPKDIIFLKSSILPNGLILPNETKRKVIQPRPPIEPFELHNMFSDLSMI